MGDVKCDRCESTIPAGEVRADPASGIIICDKCKKNPNDKQEPAERIRAQWSKKEKRIAVTGCDAGPGHWLAIQLEILCSQLLTTHGYDPLTLKLQIDKLVPSEAIAAEEPPPINPDFVDDADKLVI